MRKGYASEVPRYSMLFTVGQKRKIAYRSVVPRKVFYNYSI